MDGAPSPVRPVRVSFEIALIQKPDPQREHFDTAWTLNILIATAGAVLTAALAHPEADSGAVTLIQRFGSAANLKIHLHCLVLDGVYGHTDGEPVFVEVPAPTAVMTDSRKSGSCPQRGARRSGPGGVVALA